MARLTVRHAPIHAVSAAFLTVFLVNPRMATAATTTSAEPSNPTAPNITDDVTWLTAYLTIHSLSRNSYVYMYIFWLLVFLVFFLLACANWSGVRDSAIGARWAKWALRRRTWRKKHTLKKNEADAKRLGVPVSALHRQPKSLPSNAQILSAVVLSVIVLLMCFIGPDYINPDIELFEFSSKTKRELTQTINYNTMWPFLVHYDISKSWWTAGARTGGVAFALFPLVVVLALKAPPFAVFAIPGLVAYSHDKMIRLHRYVGRLIWFVTLLHVLFWVVQVLRDRRALTGELVFAYVWQYQKFRFAWVAFLSMTILMICSLDFIRNPHYEVFYFVHIVFAPMTIIFSALHHPQHGLWGWCAAALAIWIGERIWRGIWWLYVNGIFRAGRARKGGARLKREPGSLRPYIYEERPTEKGAMTPHRSEPERGSVATLISPIGHYGDGKKDVGQDQEQWEMNPLRAPAPRQPQSIAKLGLDEGPDNHSDYTIVSTANVSTASLYMDTHGDGPTPSPGELIDLARVETGNSNNGSTARGVPLQIQTGAGGVSAPIPTYPPSAHAKGAPMQSPGAGPGPRTTARRASLSASASASSASIAFNHRFQPHRPPRARTYTPPPGYALATLLPGRTVKLRLVTPGYQTWAPGQHFLVGIPAVSRITTHPFSVAGVCDEQAALGVDPDAYEDGDGEGMRRKRLIQAEAGRELILLVRAKKGWTKRLWDLISSLQSQGLTSAPGESLPPGSSPPSPPAPGHGATGVVLRTLVDGPFGSAGRTRWGKYSSVLIISGGSGVSFGLSVLEYVCLCIAGRDGRFLGGYPGGWGVGPRGAWVTRRVRFVWLVREYAHIQWCVSSLRRCLTIVPTDALELNIFVTNSRPPKELLISPTGMPGSEDGHADVTDDGLLKPPAPRFRAGGNGGGRSTGASLSSDESFASDNSVDSIVDSYFDGDGVRGGDDERYAVGELGHETHMLDYTNFDGDDDTPLPGEHRLSRRIIKESKMRRARSSKVIKAVFAKKELEERVAAANSRAAAASAADAYGNMGHAKTPSEELYGHGGSHRLSALSTAPLLTSMSPGANAQNQAVWPISPATSTVSAFSAFSAFDRHSHSARAPLPHLPPPLPSSSFSAFGLPPNAQGVHEHEYEHVTSGGDPRRFSISSSTIKSTPGGSTSTLSPSTGTPTGGGGGVRWAELSSTDLKSWSGSGSGPGSGPGSGLSLDAQEVRDLQVVSEWARPGKPKLGRILADEVEASKGRVAVACCGPTSLNALMRKLIAEQISPARVARGDLRGSIDFIAEDFEY